MEVRQEVPADVSAIYSVNEQAFGRPDEANLVDKLRTNNKITLSLVAEENGRIVGHVLFSPMTLETETGSYPIIGLGPVAVLPEMQRLGIGSRLIEAGLDLLKERGETAVIVLGHSDYYPRFGFVRASQFGIQSSYDVPDEAFMALELQEGSLNGRAGVVYYQPEFDGV
ncbi:MAG: N-acetyltransferase [Ardenticatenaceae bacterium]|nr:N-acetyltransferase [Ardenticatenaceae bacterium]